MAEVTVGPGGQFSVINQIGIDSALDYVGPGDRVRLVGGYGGELAYVDIDNLHFEGTAESTGVSLTLSSWQNAGSWSVHEIWLEGEAPFNASAGLEPAGWTMRIHGNNGNNGLGDGPGNDQIDGGGGNDTITVQGGNDVVAGGPGTDLLDAVYHGFSAPFTLAGTTGDDIGGYAGLLSGGSDSVAFSGIERLHLILGSGDDLIHGGGEIDDIYDENGGADTISAGAGDDFIRMMKPGDDVLDGGPGNDYIDGFMGTDLLIGGAGGDQLIGDPSPSMYPGVPQSPHDTASYASSPSGITILGLQTGIGGDAEGDWLSLIEDVIGSPFADHIEGDEVDNTFLGGGGNDYLEGRGGADLLNGGDGVNTAGYALSPTGVTVVLGEVAFGGDAAGDVLVAIANLVGSQQADSLVGDQHANLIGGQDGDDAIAGGPGDDTLVGERGNDTLIGGPGADRLIGDAALPGVEQFPADMASYDTSPAGVTVNLAEGTGAGSDAEGDTFEGVENLTGSPFGDLLIGTDGTNMIFGLDGANLLWGLGGADLLWGGGGADSLDGGAGTDVMVGGGGADSLEGGADTDSLFGSGFAGGAMEAASGSDTLAGGDGDDGLWGGDDVDVLAGGSGNDGLVGGAGDDRLYGNDGTDWLFGGDFAANGLFVPGSGDDALRGGPGNDGLWGMDGNDLIQGDAGDDYAEGFDGNDTLNGGDGNDTFLGQAGNDSLNGGAGFDYLYGGVGADTFVFNRADSFDTVWDFSVAEGDRLQLDPALGMASFADFAARIAGFIYQDVDYTVLSVVTTGQDGAPVFDQLLVKGMAPEDWTDGMVLFA